MTHDVLHTTTRRRHSRRAAAAVALTSVLAVAGLVNPASIDAAPRTKSAVVADEADRAVSALTQWQASQHPIDYVRFVQRRDQAAAIAEAELDIPAGSLELAWGRVTLDKQAALLSAVSQLGVPYRDLASEPGVGFDCSGLTIWAFGTAGVEIPRISSDQIDESASIDRDEAEAGDLVYYPGHISIYLGADMMVHAPNSGSHVEITDLPEKTLRFGDAAAAHRAAAWQSGSLMDRALAISE